MDHPHDPIERIHRAASYIRLYATLLRAPGKSANPERRALSELLHDLADWLEETERERVS